ncbi:uncharacterized protein LOC111399532 [Olea europaea subsp. europaea]|nr:uncharacterized protein LOC111399532 [Olea europaea subsp. europaea]
MDCHLSSISTLPWIWIVETLASCNQVDESILYDLVKKTPEITSDLGKNAREFVSLRIIERLFVIGAQNANPVSSSSSSKIGFDPSESCEAVLERISRETSVQNLIEYGLDTLKWDIQPFIEHKRSNSSKCTLQQLKDAILTGGHPLLSSLKEHSGLAVTNQPEHRLSVDDGDTNHVAATLKESNANALNVAANGHLISPIPANWDVLLKRSLPDENLVAKRNRSATTEFVEGQSHENEIALGNGGDTVAKSAKKFRHGIINCERDGHMNFLSSHAGKNSPPENCRNEHPSLKGLVEHDEALPCEPQVLHKGTELPKDRSGEVQSQGNHLDEIKAYKKGLCKLRTDISTCEGGIQPALCNDEYLDGYGHSSQRKVSNVIEAEDDIDHNQDADMAFDDKGYNDENDIAMKKNAFLSSQCTYSQDSLAMTDLREINLCTTCKKGGTLLVCSYNSCPLMVHEGCLGSAPTFDAGGKFYCPFCAYSRAISEFNKVKDKASMARKDLATFFRMGTVKRTKEVAVSSRREKKSQSELDEHLHDNNKLTNRNISKQDNNPQCRENHKDDCVAEPSVSCDGDNPLRGDKLADSDSEKELPILAKENEDGKRVGQECKSPGDHGKQLIAAEAVCKSGDGIPSARFPQRSNGNEHAEVRSKKKVSCQPGTDLVHQLTCSSTSNGEQISEEENESSSASKFFISIRKQGRQHSYPAFPLLRRKKIPWTRVEEETLKEGVQKFYTAHDRNIPWKKILEFGADAFLKGRTTIDLKDKWRNLCKGSPKSK